METNEIIDSIKKLEGDRDRYKSLWEQERSNKYQEIEKHTNEIKKKVVEAGTHTLEEWELNGSKYWRITPMK